MLRTPIPLIGVTHGPVGERTRHLLVDFSPWSSKSRNQVVVVQISCFLSHSVRCHFYSRNIGSSELFGYYFTKHSHKVTRAVLGQFACV
jgi:hypothetical protein